jgi:hypothetical protein
MRMSPLQATLANAVGFQLVWLGCVWGAGTGLPWLGPVLATVFAAAVLRHGGKRAADIQMLSIALPIGLVVDTLWLQLGWLIYSAAWPLEGIAPGWIMALWLGFAMTLNHSLAILRERPWLAALLGMVGGPMAYVGAERVFGAVSFVAPDLRILLGLAVAWGAVLPMLYLLTNDVPAKAELELRR